jgi:uncharacterized membrane protein YfcA
MNLLSGFHDIALAQLLLVAAVAFVASLIGGVSGYGTGALMPLVLVPLVGPEPIVPIIAISAMFSNASRMSAFIKHVDWRRAGIVLIFSVPFCVLGAWGYTRLTSAGAALVIGGMLIASVPLRRYLRTRGVKCSDRGLALGAAGYGFVVGGTAGSGVILLSLLLAAGVPSAGVIATDAAISMVIGVVKISVFGLTGVITVQVVAFALLIGVVALPGAFLAKAFVDCRCTCTPRYWIWWCCSAACFWSAGRLGSVVPEGGDPYSSASHFCCGVWVPGLGFRLAQGDS